LSDIVPEKKRRIQATGTLEINTVLINGSAIEWLDMKDFNLADLAKTLGITDEHKAKGTITIEITQHPCEMCGKPTEGDNLCEQCCKVICDACAERDGPIRYCPICFDLKKQPPTDLIQ
jgi:hypothetical protein